MRVVEQSVSLEWATPNAETLIEQAGRTCYKSDAVGDTAGFIKRIIERGHESVLEHAVASFRIVCDRGVSHELVRHRIASYSQESTRYCNYSKDKFGQQITVIQPPQLNTLQKESWLRAVRAAETAYLEMTCVGCRPEIARSVLPTCLKTEIVMTANFREWRHFLKLRTALAAHPQMREIATAIGVKLREIAPTVFSEDAHGQEGRQVEGQGK